MNSVRYRSRMATLLLVLCLLTSTLIAQAQVLPPNGSVAGTLNAATPNITYAFTVPSDGDATLTITPSVNLYANIQFFDQDGTTFRAESPLNGAGNVSTFTVTHLNGGATYYFRAIRRDGGTGTFTLSSVFTSQSIANDTEPNTSKEQALSVAMPATRRGHLGYSTTSYPSQDNEDWYKFTVPSDGDLTLTITPTGTLYVNIQFYDSDGTTFRFESPLNGTGFASEFTIPHLNPGTTYYLRVFNRSVGYGGYTITSTFAPTSLTNDTELNDGPVSALSVAMPANRTGHLGYSRASYTERDNEDWYKFTVSSDGDLTLKITPTSTLYVNIQFYDSDGTTFRFESPLNGTGAASAFTIPHLNPGTTYYLRVFNRSGGYGSYTLTGTFAATPFSTDTELNDGPATGIEFEMPATVNGHLGYSRASYNNRDNEDWYKLTVPADGDVTLTITPTNTLYVNIQFYDSNGTTHNFESPLNGTGAASAFTIPHLNPGTTYYLRVLNRSAGYGSYTLAGTFKEQFATNDAEVNDGPGSAISVPSFNEQTGHLGYSRTSFNDRDGEDWYVFTHPGGTIDVTIVNTSLLYANLQLYASNGTTFLTESPLNGTGNPSQLLTNRPAGTYFIRVLNRSAGYGAYGLNPPPTITISGTIELEDCLDSPQEVTVEARPSSGTPLVFTVNDGAFALNDLPRQNYTVSFKGAKWLRATRVVESLFGDVSIGNLLLRAGDANNDNRVDVLDLDSLILSFDQCEGDAGFITGADFNCDGCADVLDLDLLIRNFDSIGDE